MFEKAARNKYRFDSVSGPLTVEDLWTLPLESVKGPNLNDIAKAVNRKLKDQGEEDFVGNATPVNAELKNKLEIVKHVIATKKAENDARLSRAAKKAELDRLAELIQKKKEKQLDDKSLDELEKLMQQRSAELTNN